MQTLPDRIQIQPCQTPASPAGSASSVIRLYTAWYDFKILRHKHVYCLVWFQDPLLWGCVPKEKMLCGILGDILDKLAKHIILWNSEVRCLKIVWNINNVKRNLFAASCCQWCPEARNRRGCWGMCCLQISFVWSTFWMCKHPHMPC